MSEVYNYREIEDIAAGELDFKTNLRQVVEGLTPAQAITLFALADGMTEEEIGAEAGITKQAVQSRLKGVKGRMIEVFGEKAVSGRNAQKLVPVGERRNE